MSWPEKVAGALALYANPLDVHDQHIYYSTPTLHPLAFHPQFAHLTWPRLDGTFSLAEQLDLKRFHPKTWKPALEGGLEDGDDRDPDDANGEWRIGVYIGDLMVYMRGASPGSRPYARPWEVKQSDEDHRQPGGQLIRRHNKADIERTEARRLICAAYAAQMGTTVAEFSLDQVPKPLAASLVTLCRAQGMDYQLPITAVAELVAAFKEGIGQDTSPRSIARKLLRDETEVEQAKILLEHAVWQRKVRVDLHETLGWDQPLLPERHDLLERYRSLFDPQFVEAP